MSRTVCRLGAMLVLAGLLGSAVGQEKTDPPAGGRAVKPQKTTLAVGEPVVLTFADAGANPSAWVGIAKADDPADKFGAWDHTKGQKAGSITLPGLPVGAYEARGFFDWRLKPGYEIGARTAFTVKENADGFGVKTSKAMYAVEEPIDIAFTDPSEGVVVRWIGLATATDPADKYGAWDYTKDKASGTVALPGLPPGEYEVRGFTSGRNWVSVRQAFTIKELPTGVVLKPRKPAYTTDEVVEVEFLGFPAVGKDWVAVAKAGAADDAYLSHSNINKKKGGRLNFGMLPAGEYEARGYFDWPDGAYKVEARARFTVTAGKP